MRLLALAAVMLAIPAMAQEDASAADSPTDQCVGETKNATASRTDGGTKPNATVRAQIEAPAGYFLLTSTIETDSTGSRHATGSQLTVEPHPEVTGILETVAARSIAFTQSCRHRNIFGTSSCTAVARIAATQYPLECLPTLITRSLEEN